MRQAQTAVYYGLATARLMSSLTQYDGHRAPQMDQLAKTRQHTGSDSATELWWPNRCDRNRTSDQRSFGPCPGTLGRGKRDDDLCQTGIHVRIYVCPVSVGKGELAEIPSAS